MMASNYLVSRFYNKVDLDDILMPRQYTDNWLDQDHIGMDGLYFWGTDWYDSFSPNIYYKSLFPTKVNGENFLKINLGYFTSHGIKDDGTLWTWGSNYHGSLGLDISEDNLRVEFAQQVGIDSDWKEVSGFGTNCYGLKMDGTLFGWGYNGAGELGLGDEIDRSVPVQVTTNVKSLSSFPSNNLTFIKTDGTIWGSGPFHLGGTGNDSIRDGAAYTILSPIQMANGTDNWKSISTCEMGTVAVKNNNTVWGWGQNIIYDETAYSYELDIDNRPTVYIPIQINSDTDWMEVKLSTSMYGVSVYGIKQDHSLWVYGHNSYGELGLGDVDNRTEFTRVGLLNNWLSISPGEGYILAIKTDGSMWGWGVNWGGQLGLSDYINRSSPVQIGFGVNWWRCFSGLNESSFAIGYKR